VWKETSDNKEGGASENTIYLLYLGKFSISLSRRCQ
jgi:hypothetical protein